MPEPATSATVALYGAVVFVAALWLIAAWRARGGTGAAVALVVLLVTLLAPAMLARAGLLDRYDPLPAPALLVVAGIVVMTVAIALSSFGRQLASTAPLGGLVAYQVFRLPVEWMLHRLYLDGVVPVQMTFAGRNFDIVSGGTALLLGLLIASGRRPRGVIILWNLMGLGLLANIVTIAVLSTPVPFRVFTNDPPNLLPSTFPFIWLPTFLVPAALFGHIMVFRALHTRQWRLS